MQESSKFSKPCVVGAGAWGTALAELIARHERPVKLWAFEEAVIQSIGQQYENTLYLPGIKLSSRITPTGDMQDLSDLTNLLVSIHLSSSCFLTAERDIATWIQLVQEVRFLRNLLC